MKKGTFAVHRWDRKGGLAALCGTVRHHGKLLFGMRPTCRRCRFFLLALGHSRDEVLRIMAEQDRAAVARETT